MKMTKAIAEKVNQNFTSERYLETVGINVSNKNNRPALPVDHNRARVFVDSVDTEAAKIALLPQTFFDRQLPTAKASAVATLAPLEFPADRARVDRLTVRELKGTAAEASQTQNSNVQLRSALQERKQIV